MRGIAARKKLFVTKKASLDNSLSKLRRRALKDRSR
jgi:hypothetical protein